MSIQNEIQQALLRCDQATFEKVAGLYLREEIGEPISLLGSVEGKAKTRAGTPDVFATADGSVFHFLACTTVSDRQALRGKLIDDIDGCLNSDKTKVALEDIRCLHLAFNCTPDAGDTAQVHAHARQHGISINLITPAELSRALQKDYPYIAADELGIAFDSGQILPINEFIRQYGNQKLATPLDTTFRFRETLVEEGKQALLEGNALVLTGKPGTGKTRLALEIASRLQIESDWQVSCILNKGSAFHTELPRHLGSPGKHLIIADDANRIGSLIPLLGYALSDDDDRQYRFVLTVRDYAAKQVYSRLSEFANPHPIKVSHLANEELKEYLKEEFGILNDDYLRQIWRLSEGNARLATMAAQEAVKANNLERIQNVLDLYEQYYSEFDDFFKDSEPDDLKVAGLISVLRNIDASDEQTTSLIESAFGISPDRLVDSIDRLHDQELVDLHGNFIAKVSDQVLATYCFYLCFVKHEALSFQTLVEQYSGSHLPRIKDALYGAFNSLDANVIRKITDAPLAKAISNTSGDAQLELIEAFWFVDTDQNLATLKALVSALPVQDIDPCQVNWEDKQVWGEDHLLSCLSQFSHAHPTDAKVAIDLILQFLPRRPDRADKVLSVLTDNSGYGFGPDSHRYGYIFQKAVVETIVRHLETDVPIIQALFVRVAKSYLSTQFHSTWSETRHTFSFCNFVVAPTSELSAIRALIWRTLAELYESGHEVNSISEVLSQYANDLYCTTDQDVLSIDLPFALDWINTRLDPARYRDCCIAHALDHRFRRAELEAWQPDLSDFYCPAYQFSRLAFTDRYERKMEEMGWREYEKYKQDKVYAEYGDLTPQQLPVLLNHCQEICNDSLNSNHDRHQVTQALANLLSRIGDEDVPRFLVLVNRLLELGDPLELRGIGFIKQLIAAIGKHRVYELIDSHEFAGKAHWFIALYWDLDETEIDKGDAEHFMALVTGLEIGFVPHLSLLQKFENHVPEILPQLVGAILEDETSKAPARLNNLLISSRKDAEWIAEQFQDQPELLATAYITICNAGRGASGHSFDHDATLFGVAIDLCPDFIHEYVASRYQSKDFLSRHDEDHRDYTKLWERDDWPDQFVGLISAIAEHQKYDEWSDSFLSAWLIHAGANNSKVEKERLEEVLSHAIDQLHDNDECMRILFAGTNELSEELRERLLAAYVHHQPSVESFKKLRLVPGHATASGRGGLTAVYQRREKFMQRLKAALPEPEHLEYRAHLSNKEKSLRNIAESHAISDFLEDW